MSSDINSYKTPTTIEIDSLQDLSLLTDKPDIFDINLFLFKNPKLTPDRDDNQPNDITKLSLKTMSDYILKYGITLDDPSLPHVHVTQKQTFNTISYDGSQDENEPATIRDLIDEVQFNITENVCEWLYNTKQAFNVVNTLFPDYVFTLDPHINADKLNALTDNEYNELDIADFIFIGDSVSSFTTAVPDGFLEPTALTVLVAHKHGEDNDGKQKIFYESGRPVFNINNTCPKMQTDKSSSSGSQAMCLKSKHASLVLLKTRQYGNNAYHSLEKYITEAGYNAIADKGETLQLSANVEDHIGASNIQAKCVPNKATAEHHIPGLNKTSVRYKARCYRVFEKL